MLSQRKTFTDSMGMNQISSLIANNNNSTNNNSIKYTSNSSYLTSKL